MSRTPSLGPNANPSAATPAPERAARPVGGLLAVNSEYRAQATPAGSSTGARPKFKPNMRRVLKVQDDDDDECVPRSLSLSLFGRGGGGDLSS